MNATSEDIKQYYSVASGAYSRPIYDNQLEAWQTFLAGFPKRHFSSIIMACTDIWPDKMPTVPEVKREILLRMRKEGPPAKRRETEPYSEPDIPDDNPFSMLAQRWREESNRLGLDPNRPTPQDIFKKRMRELRRMLGGVTADVAI